MRYVTMDKVQPGMILSKRIYDLMDRTLLAEGKCLNEEIIRKLAERGYPGIYIEDELSKNIQIQEVISMELRNHTVHALRRMDVDEVIKSARKIVEQIMDADFISLDLVDLRTFDDYTYRHCVNVAVLSLVIALGMDYSYGDMVDLSVAAVFHDLGKILIDKEILNKPGKLSLQEVEIMKQHPQMAYDILADRWDIPAKVRAAVLCHHENEDGSGYPLGLTGDKIHPFAKIIHVADVYDALSSKRPYKEACSFSEALEYLMGGGGTMFDYKTVTAFMKYVSVYPKGITVELSDGREAIVEENYPGNQLRPKLRLMDGSILDLLDSKENRNITILRQAGTNAMVAGEIEENEKGRIRKKKHILVVDDMVASLREVKRVLEGTYKVSLAKSGAQAIEFVNTTLPDLIIMDVQMPDKNGIETVQEIRRRFPVQVPVIFVSAFGDMQTVMECRNVQAADFVVKPFQASYLLERARYALGEENE